MRGLPLWVALFLRTKIPDVADACLRFAYIFNVERHLILFLLISILTCIPLKSLCRVESYFMLFTLVDMDGIMNLFIINKARTFIYQWF